MFREQRELRDALAEPDVSFIVTPVEAEAHFIRDHDGVVRDAGEVERRGPGCGASQAPSYSSLLGSVGWSVG